MREISESPWGGGVVTITGQVSTYAEKREAERLAEMSPGVGEVIA
jgi:osmotically-inducible protein OsmY